MRGNGGLFFLSSILDAFAGYSDCEMRCLFSINQIAATAILLFGLSEQCTAQIPSLSSQEQLAVDIAVDERGWNDAAFAALVANARSWREPIGDVLARNEPDYEAMLAEPGNFRGELCLLRGVIQQQHRLEAPYADVEEWFIRDDEGLPIQVLVVHPEVANSAISFQDGAQVELFARFYKRTKELQARDGQEHRYAAFVGALPRAAMPTALTSIGFPKWLPIVFVALLVVFGVLMARVRKLRRQTGRGAKRALHEEIDEVEAMPLPENPADALAELRRRAGE